MPLNMTINGELTDVSHIDSDTPLLSAITAGFALS